MLTGTASAAFAACVFMLLSACDLTRPSTGVYVANAGLPEKTELQHVPFFPDAGTHCGPATLASVLVGSGVDTEPQLLAPYVYIPGRNGALQAEMKATARRNNRLAYELPARLDAALRELRVGRPVLVLQRLANGPGGWHYAVLVGYDSRRGEVTLHSGLTEQLRMSAAQFDHTWRAAGRWAMVVLKPGELPAEADRERYVRAASAFAQGTDPGIGAQVWHSALALWPDSLTALVGLGGAQYAMGNLDDAVHTLEQSVRRHPNAPVAHNNLAHVLGERGDIERALRHARRAVEIGGPHVAAYQQTLRALEAQ